MNDWININDRLPEKDIPVLITDGYSVQMATLLCITEGKPQWSCVASGFDADFPYDFNEWETTHWMERPKPPNK